MQGDDEEKITRARSATPANRPSRTASIAIGAAMLVALIFVMVRGPRRVPPQAPPVPAEEPAESGSPADKLDKAMAELDSLPPSQSEGVKNILSALEGVGRSSVGFKLPDGRDPPPLPADAPRTVRFGVVLVKYLGAQLAPSSAPARELARERAQTLAKIAHEDFAAAVKGGDPGSNVDIGTVKRGVLELGTEYVLFTLPVGWSSEVLDTPRGFWIVKRLR